MEAVLRVRPLHWVGSGRCRPSAVFVLHVFQKKSKQGIATPRVDIALIRERFKVAEEVAKELEQ